MVEACAIILFVSSKDNTGKDRFDDRFLIKTYLQHLTRQNISERQVMVWNRK